MGVQEVRPKHGEAGRGLGHTIRSWARLTRLHAAPLTWGALLAGVILAGQRDPSMLLMWLMFGTLYHAVGFTHNALCDMKTDRLSPHKAMFPLVSRSITRSSAETFYLCGAMAGVFCSVLIAKWNQWVALLFMMAVFWGHLYNRTSKRYLVSPLTCMMAYLCLFVFGYAATTGAGGPIPDVVRWSAEAYVATMVLFQIAVVGSLKDLERDPVSLIRRLGARISKTGQLERLRRGLDRRVLLWGWRSKTLSQMTRVGLLASGGVLWWSGTGFGPSVATVVMLLGFCVVIGLSMALLRDQPWNHDKVLRLAVAGEVAAFLWFWCLLGPFIGWPYAMTIGALATVWLVGFNRLSWGTTVRPAV